MTQPRRRGYFARQSRKFYLVTTALVAATGLLLTAGDNVSWGGWVLVAVALTLFVLTLLRVPGMPEG